MGRLWLLLVRSKVEVSEHECEKGRHDGSFRLWNLSDLRFIQHRPHPSNLSQPPAPPRPRSSSQLPTPISALLAQPHTSNLNPASSPPPLANKYTTASSKKRGKVQETGDVTFLVQIEDREGLI